ncbi:hypothetical protein B0H13DRAFT_864889 [Mycena leptocephala]|nr:hypothetical protein B0H13DRAFT_864889 [Mycena leptocephala]
MRAGDIRVESRPKADRCRWVECRAMRMWGMRVGMDGDGVVGAHPSGFRYSSSFSLLFTSPSSPPPSSSSHALIQHKPRRRGRRRRAQPPRATLGMRVGRGAERNHRAVWVRVNARRCAGRRVPSSTTTTSCRRRKRQRCQPTPKPQRPPTRLPPPLRLRRPQRLARQALKRRPQPALAALPTRTIPVLTSRRRGLRRGIGRPRERRVREGPAMRRRGPLRRSAYPCPNPNAPARLL